jgi:hypothetical protein
MPKPGKSRASHLIPLSWSMRYIGRLAVSDLAFALSTHPGTVVASP